MEQTQRQVGVWSFRRGLGAVAIHRRHVTENQHAYPEPSTTHGRT